MTIDPINVGAIIVVLISGLTAWAAQRSAAKANRLSNKETAEIEAYGRARAMDLKTIERQDEEIKELGEINSDLRKRIAEKNKQLVLNEVRIENQQIIIRALRRQMGLPAEPEVRNEQ